MAAAPSPVVLQPFSRKGVFTVLLILTAIAILVIAVSALAFLVIVIVGIHGDERRKGISAAPCTRTGAVARRVLGVHAAPHHVVHRTRADARR